MRKFGLYLLVSGFWFLVSLNGCAPKTTHRTELLMDTFIEMTVVGKGEAVERAIDAAFRRMHEIDDLMSAFKSTSELSRLNVEGEAVLSEDTYKVLKRAVEYRDLTAGAFDVTYKAPSELVFEDSTRRVRIARLGSQLDLGGIAMGYAVDEAIEALRKSDIERALLNAGGDLYALGTRPDGKPWNIGIQHPEKRNAIWSTVSIIDRAMATSGLYERGPHIIDPKTAKPVENELLSVTIEAKTCIEADALSTAVFILGPVEGRKLLDRLPDVKGILITREDIQTSTEHN